MAEATNLSAYDAARIALGRAFSGGPARFSQSGWFHVGMTPVPCPRCMGATHGFRRSHTTSAGDTYCYWALACAGCSVLFAPQQLSRDTRRLLYRWSMPRVCSLEEARMAQASDHAALLRQRDFVVPATTQLDEHERRLLLRYGRWLEALSMGALRPLTPEQEHFVRVTRGSEAPSTEFEIAWVKYSQVRAQSAGANGQQVAGAGPREGASCFARLAEARQSAAVVRVEYEQRREAVLEQVRAQLEALDAEFSGQMRASQEEIARLEAEVKGLVLQIGESVKHEGIHAVYMRGRRSWDSRGLNRYAESHPELQEFRRVGAPSVSLRYQMAELQRPGP